MIAARAPVEVLEEIDSTLLEARRRAERGEVAPVWLIARRQTAGRGRRGRSWISFDGNLMATHLFTTDRSPNDIAMLGFVVAVSIAQTLESFVDAARITLKWPNDVLVDGAKIAGILIESANIGGGLAWVALAFGVNVAAAPQAIDQQTTSLREAAGGSAVEADVLFAAVRSMLEIWCGRFLAEGFAPVREAWLRRAHGLGGPISVSDGGEGVKGLMRGISPLGALEVETEAGLRIVTAGDVFFAKPA